MNRSEVNFVPHKDYIKFVRDESIMDAEILEAKEYNPEETEKEGDKD